MNDVALRRAGPADAAAVRALARLAFAKWVPVIGREPTPMTADYEQAVREHRIDLVEIEGTLAALIEMIPKPDHVLIETLAVAPEFQGRGLGTRLLAHAEAVAVEAGHDTLRLYTNQEFTENIALYRRRGYAIESEAPFLGGISVLMAKPLSRTATTPSCPR